MARLVRVGVVCVCIPGLGLGSVLCFALRGQQAANPQTRLRGRRAKNGSLFYLFVCEFERDLEAWTGCGGFGVCGPMSP